MADDTAIAAVTLSNGNRQVFFQEESGYLRSALYSAEARIWQTSNNKNLGSLDSPSSMLPFAKNSTPLAAAVRREYKDMVTLFYMGPKDNHLSCLDWQTNGDHNPCMINSEQSLFAADSGQISATWMPNNDTSRYLLLIYPDPSQKLTVLRLSLKQTFTSNMELTSIINETAKFNSALNEAIQRLEPGSPDASLSRTCTAVSYQSADDFGESFYLNCFVNPHIGEAPSEMDGHESETPPQESSVVEFRFKVDINNGNISITGDTRYYDARPITQNSDSVLTSTEREALFQSGELHRPPHRYTEPQGYLNLTRVLAAKEIFY
ncbi:MAG: hypothetical protein Q9205_003910 [Flavoplaca limonia]